MWCNYGYRYKNVCIYLCVRACVRVRMRVRVRVYVVFVYMYVVNVRVCVCQCVCLYMFVRGCVFIHRIMCIGHNNIHVCNMHSAPYHSYFQIYISHACCNKEDYSYLRYTDVCHHSLFHLHLHDKTI